MPEDDGASARVAVEWMVRARRTKGDNLSDTEEDKPKLSHARANQIYRSHVQRRTAGSSSDRAPRRPSTRHSTDLRRRGQ